MEDLDITIIHDHLQKKVDKVYLMNEDGTVNYHTLGRIITDIHYDNYPNLPKDNIEYSLEEYTNSIVNAKTDSAIVGENHSVIIDKLEFQIVEHRYKKKKKAEFNLTVQQHYRM